MTLWYIIPIAVASYLSIGVLVTWFLLHTAPIELENTTELAMLIIQWPLVVWAMFH